MVSYHVGHQPLNSPTTPFSTSRKVLQSYNLFPNQPNFFLDFFVQKVWHLQVKSMALTGQNHGSFGSKVWELRLAFATPEFRKLVFALRDNRQQTMVIRQLLVVCEAIAKPLKAHDS